MTHLVTYRGFKYRPVTACGLYWLPVGHDDAAKPDCPECVATVTGPRAR